MAPPESVPSATVTDIAEARRERRREEDESREEGTSASGRKGANRRFDAEKVERLKAEIAAGRYRIDAESVADRFIEHERNN